MNIYVGNLSHQTTEDDLRQAFEAFGQVESVNIIKDRFSGESRGFGFVEIASKQEAQKAIEEMNGKDLMGRAVMSMKLAQKLLAVMAAEAAEAAEEVVLVVAGVVVVVAVAVVADVGTKN